MLLEIAAGAATALTIIVGLMEEFGILSYEPDETGWTPKKHGWWLVLGIPTLVLWGFVLLNNSTHRF